MKLDGGALTPLCFFAAAAATAAASASFFATLSAAALFSFGVMLGAEHTLLGLGGRALAGVEGCEAESGSLVALDWAARVDILPVPEMEEARRMGVGRAAGVTEEGRGAGRDVPAWDGGRAREVLALRLSLELDLDIDGVLVTEPLTTKRVRSQSHARN